MAATMKALRKSHAAKGLTIETVPVPVIGAVNGAAQLSAPTDPSPRSRSATVRTAKRRSPPSSCELETRRIVG